MKMLKQTKEEMKTGLSPKIVLIAFLKSKHGYNKEIITRITFRIILKLKLCIQIWSEFEYTGTWSDVRFVALA